MSTSCSVGGWESCTRKMEGAEGQRRSLVVGIMEGVTAWTRLHLEQPYISAPLAGDDRVSKRTAHVVGEPKNESYPSKDNFPRTRDLRNL